MIYEVVRATWLTQKPKELSLTVAFISTMVLAIGSLVYLLDFESLGSLMFASGKLVFQDHQWWRAWTSLFAHADLGHLASNVLLFFILGFFLYGYFGTSLFPLGALIWGGLINLLVLKTYDPKMVLIGMSGVVYWMGGVWLILYFFLSRQKDTTQRWLRTLGVAILIFMPAETFQPEISYRSHLVGFVLGLVAGGWHFFWHRKRFRKAEIRETVVEE
jgi:rhomboid protease GluP